MIPEIGHFALIIALALACIQAFFPIAGAARGNPLWIALARPAARGQFFFIAIAFLCLMYSFINNDFSVMYVAQNSNSFLPLQYRISAVWGGHEGSLLLWALILGLWTLAVSIFSRNLPETFVARVLGVMGILSIGFLLFMLLTSNPFERLWPSPQNGSDLNPLLQDIGLILHPPMLYMGYVGFSVVFGLAIAALLDGRIDTAWARWARPWTVVAWIFLTIGIALGSWWAYYELGWGGWWFWDPVENASFMPWLVGTALIHSLAATEKRGLFKSWTLLLSITAFSLSLLGTFLVRSGVIESVHAFASDPGRGLFILVFLGLCVGGALALYAKRAALFRSNAGFSPVSRESFLLFNNILLVAATGLILLGTTYPMFMDAFGLGKISVGPPYFESMFLVPMLPMVFLLALGMHAAWKKASFESTKQILLILLAVAVVLAIAVPLAFYGWNSVMTSVGLLAAFWVAGAALVDPITRWRKGHSLPANIIGMSVAHFGVAMFIIGATTVESYKQETDLSLKPGQSTEHAGFTFTLNKLEEVSGPNYEAVQGEVVIA